MWHPAAKLMYAETLGFAKPMEASGKIPSDLSESFPSGNGAPVPVAGLISMQACPGRDPLSATAFAG